MNATQMPARLTAEDRAFMLYVARRDYQRGQSSLEEYREVLQRCRHQPGMFSHGLNWMRRIFLRQGATSSVTADGHQADLTRWAAPESR
jgi:hypothetical protein